MVVLLVIKLVSLVNVFFIMRKIIDYSEIFSHVVKKPTIHVILSLVAQYEWFMRQLDVKNDFLHGDLRDEVYMQQPQGFVQVGSSPLVCKLMKSLYDLKQTPCAWFECFTPHILTCFVASSVDSSLFICKHGTSLTYLLLYVDNIIVTENDSYYIDGLVIQLCLRFDLTDLSALKYFLGLEVAHTLVGISVTWAKYAKDILNHFGMIGKPCNALMSLSSYDNY